MKHWGCLLLICGILIAADDAKPTAPKSPKATDAIRLNKAAHRKADMAYWLACEDADRKLAQALGVAADAAHARNDGTEETACLEARKDALSRIDTETGARVNNSAPAALKPLRFEDDATNTDDKTKAPASGSKSAQKAPPPGPAGSK